MLGRCWWSRGNFLIISPRLTPSNLWLLSMSFIKVLFLIQDVQGFMLQLLEALSFAHERNIAHLDIKVRASLGSVTTHSQCIHRTITDTLIALPLYGLKTRPKLLVLFFLWIRFFFQIPSINYLRDLQILGIHRKFIRHIIWEN